MRGLMVIIAGAGMARHCRASSPRTRSLPVIGVPIVGKSLSGLDSLLSIAQMPPGVPVPAWRRRGQERRAYAARILALTDHA